MLCNGVAHSRFQRPAWVEEDNWRAEAAKVGLVVGVVAEVGVVAGYYKQRVLVPWLTSCLLEELPYGIVGVAYAFVYHYSFFGINVLIFLGNFVGMVG